jgi:hypothetical protein
MEKIRNYCTFSGCPKHFDAPGAIMVPPKGWAHLSEWGVGVRDGFYCEAHADALEAMLMSGELETLQAGAQAA